MNQKQNELVNKAKNLSQDDVDGFLDDLYEYIDECLHDNKCQEVHDLVTALLSEANLSPNNEWIDILLGCMVCMSWKKDFFNDTKASVAEFFKKMSMSHLLIGLWEK